VVRLSNLSAHPETSPFVHEGIKCHHHSGWLRRNPPMFTSDCARHPETEGSGAFIVAKIVGFK
ncbi:hypothetical protein, partial [Paenibacillus sp. IHBB 3054]|uniref:hypothetical protein n=1 Tax=Paenibacillus sp. IHBB 3054 TaxID=3425689 RepID=UPI003F676AA1